MSGANQSLWLSITAAGVVLLSTTQLVLSLFILQAVHGARPQTNIVIMCAAGAVLIGTAAGLQNENDHRFVFERRIALLLYYAVSIQRFLMYGCETVCESCAAIGLARLVIAHIEAILVIPMFVLTIRQRSRAAVTTPAVDAVELLPHSNATAAVRQRIVSDAAEDSMHTVPLGSQKNE